MELTGEVRKCRRCKRRLSVSMFTVTQRKTVSTACNKCRAYEGTMAQKYRDAWSPEQREAWRVTNRDRQRAIRDEMLREYGGKCACCGESRHEFLAIDHIHGGGKKDRLESGGWGSKFFRVLKKRGWPKDGYRLLCHNCNCARGWYGYCPHEKARQAHKHPIDAFVSAHPYMGTVH